MARLEPVPMILICKAKGNAVNRVHNSKINIAHTLSRRFCKTIFSADTERNYQLDACKYFYFFVIIPPVFHMQLINVDRLFILA